jgi:hypothetical protein
LLGHGPEILLTGLQSSHFLAGRSLEVHGEPHRPNEEANDPGRYVLGNLAAFF